MMIESISILSIGLILLLVGSNLLVTSTDNAARRFSISGFYASFFMIGIATSAPEIFISIESALQNKTILAIGNAFGSNISNIALVFCVSLLFPLLYIPSAETRLDELKDPQPVKIIINKTKKDLLRLDFNL